MKLNPDCVRDLLLSLESLTEANQTYFFPQWDDEEFDYASEYPLLAKYSPGEIEYHVQQCLENDFFLDGKIGAQGHLSLRDISPKAHEFLANIRSEENYSRTKKVAAKVGSFSLSAITTIAQEIVTGAIKDILHL